jgi:hypothetical protein
VLRIVAETRVHWHGLSALITWLHSIRLLYANNAHKRP